MPVRSASLLAGSRGPARASGSIRSTLLLGLVLVIGACAGPVATPGPAPAGTAPAGESSAPTATPPSVVSGGFPVMPASQLDTANIAWLATDPPDPTDPPPTPSPTPLPATTPRAGSGVPSTAWRVPILMYHLITAPVPAEALPGLVVSPTLFDLHMHALKDAGWSTITAAQLSAALSAGNRPPARTVVVTFDDGYADGYTNALPILRRYGYVGTFYVITDRFDSPPFLTSEMVRALAGAGMEVANHTRQHVDLGAIGYTAALAQITGANDAIGSLTGVRPTTLAYPYGSVNTTAVRAAADAGITLATTTVEGCLEYPANRLSAPRIRVSPSMSAAYLLGVLQPCIGG